MLNFASGAEKLPLCVLGGVAAGAQEWAKGMAPPGRDPLTGAMIMRPTDAQEEAKAAQPAEWGFNPEPVAHADENSAFKTASTRSGV